MSMSNMKFQLLREEHTTLNLIRLKKSEYMHKQYEISLTWKRACKSMSSCELVDKNNISVSLSGTHSNPDLIKF